MAVEQLVVALRVLLAGLGGILSYRGLWVHERFVMFQGFVAGAFVGAVIGLAAGTSGLHARPVRSPTQQPAVARGGTRRQ